MTPAEQLALDLKSKVASAAAELAVSIKHLGKPKDPAEPEEVSKGKAYETWVAFEIASRLKSASINVTCVNHKGTADSEFRVRGSPGQMPGTKASGLQPCHFRIASAIQTIELHISLQHRGSSGALHELDISVVPSAPVPAWLAKLKRPYYGDCYLGIELKNYTLGKSIDLNIARAFLGAAVDLDWRTVWRDRAGRHSYMVLLTAAVVPDSGIRLLGHYNIEAYSEVFPLLGDTKPLDRIADWLRFVLSSPVSI